MPNIDRDDENATRYEAAPGIERCKSVVDCPHPTECEIKGFCIAAAQMPHKSIVEAERPEPEPTILTLWRTEYASTVPKREIIAYIDDLLAYAERMRVERDAYKAVLEGFEYQDIDGLSKKSIELCRLVGETAKNAVLEIQAKRKLAESQRDALIALMKEPDREMLMALCGNPLLLAASDEQAAREAAVAMSAVALRKVGICS